MALREDEVAAAATGINTTTTKLLAFAIGASVSGLAGAFYGSLVTIVSPDDFSFSVSIAVLSIIVLGGIGNITGVILGSFILTFVIFWVLPDMNAWSTTVSQTVHVPALANIDFSSFTFPLYGIALILMMLLRPGGLLPSRARRIELESTGKASRSPPCRVSPEVALLELDTVTKRFGGLLAVSSVSFKLDKGEILSMIGPNGAGKTTAFNCVTGLFPITSGSITLDGASIAGLPPHRITKMGIAQNVSEHPALRVHDRGGQRDGRCALVDEGARVGRGTQDAPRPTRRAIGRSSERSSSSTFSVSHGTPVPTRARCHTDCNVAWRSPARWRPSRVCCCSTSRPPVSTQGRSGS